MRCARTTRARSTRAGSATGTTLVCPWHWYRFDLDTGACATNSDYRLATYPIVERDGQWFADVGEPPVARSWAERLRAHARGSR